jgi:hypothetical protein
MQERLNKKESSDVMFESTRGEFITQIFLPLEINAD